MVANRAPRHLEAHHSTALEVNTLVLREVERRHLGQ